MLLFYSRRKSIHYNEELIKRKEIIMKSYKEIENSRNKRLWVTQVIIPVATLATSVMVTVPEARNAIVNKTVQAKDFIKDKFSKKESKQEEPEVVVISINAKNRQEALKALEALAKEVMESDNADEPINKKVRAKTAGKA